MASFKAKKGLDRFTNARLQKEVTEGMSNAKRIVEEAHLQLSASLEVLIERGTATTELHQILCSFDYDSYQYRQARNALAACWRAVHARNELRKRPQPEAAPPSSVTERSGTTQTATGIGTPMHLFR